MLLRSVTTHIKQQNWFAVGLDFLIVVAGVFVGLQVQNWASERGRQELEASYSLRLHDQVMSLQDTRAPLIRLRENWRAELVSIAPLLFGEEERAITLQECEAIGYSYIMSNPTDDVASLIELQQSGRLSMFRNKKVSEALNTFLLTRARVRDSQAGIKATNISLFSSYPHLVKVTKSSEHHTDKIVTAQFQCDLAGMRADQAFLNDFQLTQSNYSFHVFDNARVSQSLAGLHDALDEVLSVTHSEVAF
jgi:hypothetical protein